MKRKVFLIIFSVLILLVAGGYFGFKYLKTPTFLAYAIREEIDNYSIILVKNNRRLIDKNADVLRPLASTLKIIIAIEYAEQVAAGKIDETEAVPLEELERYYIADTDGGAHPGWLKHLNEKGLVYEAATPLAQVAYGMLRFSSNANTEYLLDKLGLEHVNNRIAVLGLKQHQPLFYLASSLFLKGDLDKLSDEAYHQACADVHQQLKSGVKLPYEQASDEKQELARQKQWSNRLPAATASEYYALMSRINQRNYFQPTVQEVLERLMEWPMESKNNEEWATRMGAKGGSTLWVLNTAMYVETKGNERYEFIMFSNFPSHNNNTYLAKETMGKFLKTLFTDPVKADKLIGIINR